MVPPSPENRENNGSLLNHTIFELPFGLNSVQEQTNAFSNAAPFLFLLNELKDKGVPALLILEGTEHQVYEGKLMRTVLTQSVVYPNQVVTLKSNIFTHALPRGERVGSKEMQPLQQVKVLVYDPSLFCNNTRLFNAKLVESTDENGKTIDQHIEVDNNAQRDEFSDIVKYFIAALGGRYKIIRNKSMPTKADIIFYTTNGLKFVHTANYEDIAILEGNLKKEFLKNQLINFKLEDRRDKDLREAA